MALRSNLPRFAAGLPAAIDRAVEDTARDIERVASQLAPVDTGALQTSIEVFGVMGSGERTIEAGQSLDYAAYVEYGTARQAAQPFMTPAAEQNRTLFQQRTAAQLKDLERKSRL